MLKNSVLGRVGWNRRSCQVRNRWRVKPYFGLMRDFVKQPSLGNSAIVADKELCLPRCLFGSFACDWETQSHHGDKAKLVPACDIAADSRGSNSRGRRCQQCR